ncbi:MAG TPA: hypothetical protein VGM87_25070, partial [Roseomonas sp.]
MIDRAVVYVTDPGFLVPSLVSALEVQQQVSAIADIIICLTGFPDAEGERVAEIIENLGFSAKLMSDSVASDAVHFNKTHVPISTLARFFL